MRRVVVLLLVAAIGAWAAWRSGDLPPQDEFAAAAAATGAPYESRRVALPNGVDLHVAFAGPEDGPPVVLIHGFPEFWYSWRRQMAGLAEASYRVAAPDLRGYNRSSKPRGREAYTLEAYASDIVALMDAEGWDSACLAGHDVGAAVLWTLAYNHPGRVKQAVAFNVAPPPALADAVAAGGKSVGWYRTFFRLPFLPELALRAGGYAVLGRSMQKGATPGAFTDEDVALYKAAWARDGAMSTMLGLYRADGLTPPWPKSAPPAPSSLVVVKGDPYLPVAAIGPARSYLGADNVEVWEEGGHWTLQEQPDRSLAVMLRACRQPDQSTGQ